ncbi:FAD-dependent monooxygenase [uncultured Algimonas sp.]|uniref:FAD-dependent monooxygenase n=1 Tax=uncultured Algimonas sp. TaxID=1547920 RepID=UPI0026307295|nr:FAD-dependent monooxygenase [uncultured Algimonas sp.]
MSATQNWTDRIAVVGAGLSGLLAALALSDETHGPGRDVVLIDAGDIDRPARDGRITALTPSALRLLARLGISDLDATPVTAMRVGEGDADTPWQFELPERPDDPLALNVENEALRHALLAELRARGIPLRGGLRADSLSQDGPAELGLSDGTALTASLIVAADGRNSALRRMAGLSVSRSDYGQHALVTTVTHAEPHDGIALQRFQPVGAVASLPLATVDGHHRSQIVWSDRPGAVQAACALPDDALAALIDERLWSALDVTGIDTEVQSYPLIGLRSEALSRDRVALVGDAARVIHPLAGQGWNLAVRDVAALVQGVREAVETGQDIGKAGLLGYERWRRVDETLLAAVTTALSVAPRRGPLSLIGHARRAAFAAVDEIPSLHGLIRREAAGETGERPPLLR